MSIPFNRLYLGKVYLGKVSLVLENIYIFLFWRSGGMYLDQCNVKFHFFSFQIDAGHTSQGSVYV